MGKRKPPKGDSQLELFSAIFTDIVTRDAQDTMAVPFQSLSKRARFEPIEYRDVERGIEVTVSGGRPWGIASIWDWDLIMWLLSQIRHAVDNGEEVSSLIRFHRHAFLKDARRATGGAQYKRLEESITRLKNTHVRTSIRAANGKTEMFNWIERATIERDEKGRMANAIVKLPDWLFRAVRDHTLILSLHRDYFLLTGGFERWLYRFMRKSAGNNKAGWEWKFRTLHERSGSTQRFSDFCCDLRDIVAKGRLLDYEVTETRKGEHGEPYLRGRRVREEFKPVPDVVNSEDAVDFLATTEQQLTLKSSTYEEGKRVAPGYDIYALEESWKSRTIENGIPVKYPDTMFLRWCEAVAKRRPLRRAG